MPVHDQVQLGSEMDDSSASSSSSSSSIDAQISCTCHMEQDKQDTSVQQQQSQLQLHHPSCALITLLKQQQQSKLKQILLDNNNDASQQAAQQLLQQQEQLQLQLEQQRLERIKKQKQILLEESRKRKRDPFEPIRVIPTKTFDLYSGSKFRGIQRSGEHSYDVRVDIKNVNLDESFLCGYLHIDGLTEEYPELTTYFEAEIIGPKYSFHTRKWDADEMIDEEHWTQFEAFECLANSVFNRSDIDEDEDMEEEEDEQIRRHHHHHQNGRCPHHQSYNPQTYSHKNEDVVFMRWKEHFLVPDHNIDGISGASFAGFYYICYNKKTSAISGYYYHQSSEK
ncbi:GID complex subunit 4, VID24 [Entomortierella lignicola]|nr:GID complex subunit 4, VID24 [Entomortierella lignicola]